VVRDRTGDPVVIRNSPLLEDGTPMPTRYWLVGRSQCLAVDRLESEGGVRAAEAAVDPERLAAAHAAYATERDAAVPWWWTGPRPAGGVGGARTGVKCLHAHYAWHLAGGDDPVGHWVAARLEDSGGPEAPGAVAEPDARQSAPPGPPESAARPSVLPRQHDAVAAIDCGTNSTRLLVAGPDGKPRDRLMRITRLGQGVDERHRLDPAAVERTVSVLREYRMVMDRERVGRVRMTATSAARDAANRDDFFVAATAAVGVRPELLGGEEEGRLSFVGATMELDPASGPWLVVDIGGGSTELAVGPDIAGAPTAVRSLDMGCVRITERFLRCDPPSPDQLAAARRHVAAILAGVSREEPAFGDGTTLVGLAGTVSALAAIDQRIGGYDRQRLHHYTLTRMAVERLLSELAGEPAAARRLRPGLEPDRADVIVGGTVVLAEVMHHFHFETCLTSEADILDGLVSTLLHG
jgi:exopolyphosphatase / guanosine-5'-triphosphate,3'-diphosphate pyrophosphatase